MKSSLRRSLLKSLILVGAASFSVALIPVMYLAIHVDDREQAVVFQSAAHLGAQFARPSLTISDYLESRRLLGMMTEKGHLAAAIVTADGDLLLADNTQAELFRDFARNVASEKRCPPAPASGFYCEVITSEIGDGYVPDALGYVIVKPTLHGSSISLWFLVAGVSTVALALLVTALSLRLLINRRWVEPLEVLRTALEGANFETVTGSDLTRAKFELDELVQLRDTFVRLIERLRNEEVRRSELELEKIRHEAESEAQKSLVDLAAQVAHDIRSPLSALTMADRDFKSLPEETRLLVRTAVGRISDIANQLLDKYRPSQKRFPESASSTMSPTGETSTELISSLVEQIVSEKRSRFCANLGVSIRSALEDSGYGLFARVNGIELKRALSNLIDNAVEAIPTEGVVEIRVRSARDGMIEILIEDTGRGIPTHLLARIGERGATFGKSGGSGLGLFQARQSLEGWGGRLLIDSVVGRGTQVALRIPRSEPPEWFASHLTFEEGSKVLVIDDDESVHGIWRGRWELLRLAQSRVSREHFAMPDAVKSWFAENGARGERLHFLVDYEFIGSDDSGLRLISDLGIASRSYLVTSRHDEETVREQCLALGVKIVPKNMAAFVPLLVTAPPAQ